MNCRPALGAEDESSISPIAALGADSFGVDIWSCSLHQGRIIRCAPNRPKLSPLVDFPFWPPVGGRKWERRSSEPVPLRQLHPLKSSAFHGALFRQLGTLSGVGPLPEDRRSQIAVGLCCLRHALPICLGSIPLRKTDLPIA